MVTAQRQTSRKTTLITGGVKRIGAAIAHKLHAEGHQLVLHYRGDEAIARALQAELNTLRADSVQIVQADLTKVDSAERIVQTCVEAFGRLDVLVNNASAFFATPLKTASTQNWAQLMDVNLKAPFFLSQAAAAILAENQGCIINLIDIYAERPLADHPIYTASKAGLAALTRSLAIDLAPKVRVNGIAPGAILWPEFSADENSKEQRKLLLSRTPLMRLGRPDDIANTAWFLADQAPFITGQIINVDGGRSVVP